MGVLDGTLRMTVPDHKLRETIIEALTFHPKVRGPPPKEPVVVRAYTEDADGTLRVPRFFDTSVTITEDRTSDGAPLRDDVVFAETLYGDQQVAQDRCLSALRSRGGCVMVRRAGGGKTVLALSIAHALGRRTLVLVHKSFFLEQWTERIRKFLPNATVGVIRQSKVDVDSDIVIGMIQTVVRRNYGEVLRTFGTVVVDECHHMGAPVFMSCLFKEGLAPKYLLGLSATPDRADGLTPILKLGMGEFIDTNSDTSASGGAREIVHVSMLNYHGGERREVKTRAGHVMMPIMINSLVDDVERTAIIVDRTVRLHENGHQVIVLSDRLKQLDDICAGLVVRLSDDEVAYYVGSTPARERAKATQRGVLLATYSMAKEGVHHAHARDF